MSMASRGGGARGGLCLGLVLWLQLAEAVLSEAPGGREAGLLGSGWAVGAAVLGREAG